VKNAACQLANPFPGLRPFGAGEADLFFGRDRQVDDLLRRLGRQRLLVVVGTSGSGKSSLVQAGLVPALQSGYMAGAGTRWRVVGMRPQSDPIGSLAVALYAAGALREMALAETAALGIVETTLRRSSLGLVDAVRLLALQPNENLLVVVDQFEEVFRYADLARERGSADDAAAFVQLLLQAVRQPATPLYVVLTMRSDFLGDCARFRALPEAISDGQYLIPRMSRDELHQAITCPVGVHGCDIDESLVQRLLNDVGDDPDQLPVLQHALMRAWDHWRSSGDGLRSLGLDDLEAIGGLADALSRHADDAWKEDLDDVGRELAARLFRCLTERVAGPRELRRPTALTTLQAITGAGVETLTRVIDVFRTPGRSFLMPPNGVALAPHTEIDISHESLIRQWKRLRGWVDQEWESRSMYLRLVQAAELRRAGEAGLWTQPALGRARRWVEQERPVAAWADRYTQGLAQALAFVEESQAEWERQQDEAERKARAEREAAARELKQARELARLQAERADEQRQRLDDQARQQRRMRRIYAVLTLALLIGLGTALWGLNRSLVAKAQANVERVRAEGLAAAAEASRSRAELALAKAVDSEAAEKRTAESLTVTKDKLVEALRSADERRGEAERQKARAETESRSALAAREEARQASLRAQADVERMQKLIRTEVTDAVLRDRLLAQMPGVGPVLNVTQQIARDSKAAAATRSDQAGARVPQAPGFKLWRNGVTLRVRFIGGTPAAQASARAAAEEWSRHANLRFRFVDEADAEIRVGFDRNSGAWSFMGIDALGIPGTQPTMNLGWIEAAAPLQQFGHVLGLINEHQNPNARLPWNRDAVYKEFTGSPNFWDRSLIENSVLRPVSISGYREFDVDSVMMKLFPGHYFTDGVARGGKTSLSDGDKAWARRLYPPN